MNTAWADSYNEAIDLMKNQRSHEAGILLLNLYERGVRSPHLLWTLGLHQISQGYPYEGLRYWHLISANDIQGLEEKQALVQSYLPRYEVIYGRYNEAVSHLHRDQASHALEVFTEILKNNVDLQLPVLVYHGYLLALGSIGRGKEAIDQMSSFPDAVRNDPLLVRYADQWKVDLEASHTLKRSKRNMLIGNLAIATVIMIGTAGVTASIMNNKQSKQSYTSPAVEVLSPSASPSSPTASEGNALDATLYQQLQTDIVDLNEELERSKLDSQIIKESAKRTEDKLIELEQSVAIVSGSVDQLKHDAAYKAYRQGREYLKSNQLEEAVKSFRLSVDQGSDDYFSDDNLYEYIRLIWKLEGQEAALPMIESFLSNENENYEKSPYKDDLLFMKAQYLLADNRTDEGLLALHMLEESYAEEWTGRQASQLLQTLGGHSG
ncbi:MAG: hypothetical protein P0Y55_05250 [Candidatus Cohnella colombiensis]|uniref:Tetratricopeptide repeat protein n=1 Tax=Candidatus Cohnella colombiensis TaxID=3121368 RepID=A0AA95JGY3_9BACL|nr:MAG: hypothetical protein P0Y55_05250 [Cohnella sp.]